MELFDYIKTRKIKTSVVLIVLMIGIVSGCSTFGPDGVISKYEASCVEKNKNCKNQIKCVSKEVQQRIDTAKKKVKFKTAGDDLSVLEEFNNRLKDISKENKKCELEYVNLKNEYLLREQQRAQAAAVVIGAAAVGVAAYGMCRQGGCGGGGGAYNGCCKICTVGKACGNTCIDASYTCYVGPGCACNGY